MADYKTIHGVNLRDYTTDPDTLIEGQVWYDKTNKVVQYFHDSVTTDGAWRTGGTMNTVRRRLVGAGTQTAALAISGACSITFVDPPNDIDTIIAFLIESRVTISLGVIFFSIKFAKYSTSCAGKTFLRRKSCDAGETI